jgi:hypothetical protein
MRKLILALGAASAAVLMQPSAPAQAQVDIIYPWCAQYGGRSGGGTNCGFTTYAQCMAAISGNGGSCQMNPFYEPAPAPARKRRG